MNKSVILMLIKKKYPFADIITVEFDTMHIYAVCLLDEKKDIVEPAGETENLKLLADYYNLSNMKKIIIDMRQKTVKLIGDTTKII